MELSPVQLFLQLGAIGAVLFVVWKLGAKWLDRQGENEKERTAAIAEGFKQITTSINTHHARDIESHAQLAESHSAVRTAIARVEGKIDATLDWHERTPVDTPRPTRVGTYYGPSRPGT